MKGSKWFWSILATGAIISLTGGLCGCGPGRQIEEKDPFLQLYTSKVDVLDDSKPLEAPSKLFDLSAHDMTIIQLAEWFSDHTNSGVIWSQEADGFKFSGEFRRASPDEIMGGLSRRYGFEVVKLGRTYYLGKLQPEDRGFLVRRIRGYDKDEILQAVGTFVSTNGKVIVQSDGVVVVSDREAVLSRISSMLDQLESSVGNTWILQFFVLNVKKDLSLEAGGQVTTSGQLAYNISKTQTGGTNAATDWQNVGQQLQAVLNASSSYVEQRAAPMFLLRDGSDGSWSDGETVPIPQKTVSSYGTVQTTGYSFVDTGLSLKAHLRECPGGATLKMEFSDSSITGYVEDYPTVAKVATSAVSQIQSGKVYLVSELHRRKNSDDLQKVADFTATQGGRKMQVWCRCFRVSAPVDGLKVDWKESPNVESSIFD